MFELHSHGEWSYSHVDGRNDVEQRVVYYIGGFELGSHPRKTRFCFAAYSVLLAARRKGVSGICSD